MVVSERHLRCWEISEFELLQKAEGKEELENSFFKIYFGYFGKLVPWSGRRLIAPGRCSKEDYNKKDQEEIGKVNNCPHIMNALCIGGWIDVFQ